MRGGRSRGRLKSDWHSGRRVHRRVAPSAGESGETRHVSRGAEGGKCGETVCDSKRLFENRTGAVFQRGLLNEVPKLKSVRNESGNLRPYSTVFLIIILKMDLSEL